MHRERRGTAASCSLQLMIIVMMKIVVEVIKEDESLG